MGDSGYSSGRRRPYSMIIEPGFKAYEAGVSAASYAAQFLGEPSYKKTKMPPVRVTRRRANAAPRRNVTKYNKPQSSTSVVKDAILKMAAPYHNCLSDTTNGSSLVSGSIYSINLTAFINQGTNNTERQGDQVFLEALKFRGYVRSATGAAGYVYRILIGWSGEEHTLTNLSLTGLTTTQIFLPTSAAYYNPSAAVVNPKAFTVLYDNHIDINSQITGVSDITSVSGLIGLKQKFMYQSTGSALGKTKNLYMVVIGTLPGATLGVTAAGDCGFMTDLIFKNL